MIGYSLGTSVMMQLGAFQFSVAAAAYQELRRSTEFRWPAQDLYGRLPALQYTGPGSDTITLTGVIYPEFRGGLGQLNKMRNIAGAGRPLLLVSGTGSILGRWVIEKIDEGQTVFAASGMPRKQEFTLQLRKREA